MNSNILWCGWQIAKGGKLNSTMWFSCCYSHQQTIHSSLTFTFIRFLSIRPSFGLPKDFTVFLFLLILFLFYFFTGYHVEHHYRHPEPGFQRQFSIACTCCSRFSSSFDEHHLCQFSRHIEVNPPLIDHLLSGGYRAVI